MLADGGDGRMQVSTWCLQAGDWLTAVPTCNSEYARCCRMNGCNQLSRLRWLTHIHVARNMAFKGFWREGCYVRMNCSWSLHPCENAKKEELFLIGACGALLFEGKIACPPQSLEQDAVVYIVSQWPSLYLHLQGSLSVAFVKSRTWLCFKHAGLRIRICCAYRKMRGPLREMSMPHGISIHLPWSGPWFRILCGSRDCTCPSAIYFCPAWRCSPRIVTWRSNHWCV